MNVVMYLDLETATLLRELSPDRNRSAGTRSIILSINLLPHVPLEITAPTRNIQGGNVHLSISRETVTLMDLARVARRLPNRSALLHHGVRSPPVRELAVEIARATEGERLRIAEELLALLPGTAPSTAPLGAGKSVPPALWVDREIVRRLQSAGRHEPPSSIVMESPRAYSTIVSGRGATRERLLTWVDRFNDFATRNSIPMIEYHLPWETR